MRSSSGAVPPVQLRLTFVPARAMVSEMGGGTAEGGAVSAFALTEQEVGSDPANLATTATRTPEGDYILDGE